MSLLASLGSRGGTSEATWEAKLNREARTISRELHHIVRRNCPGFSSHPTLWKDIACSPLYTSPSLRSQWTVRGRGEGFPSEAAFGDDRTKVPKGHQNGNAP